MVLNIPLGVYVTKEVHADPGIAQSHHASTETVDSSIPEPRAVGNTAKHRPRSRPRETIRRHGVIAEEAKGAERTTRDALAVGLKGIAGRHRVPHPRGFVAGLQQCLKSRIMCQCRHARQRRRRTAHRRTIHGVAEKRIRRRDVAHRRWGGDRQIVVGRHVWDNERCDPRFRCVELTRKRGIAFDGRTCSSICVR